MFVFILGLILSTNIYAQSASATWALTADTAALVSGNVIAPVQYLTSADTNVTMTVKDYYCGTPDSIFFERIWKNGYYWKYESAQNDNRYIQYSIAPVAGYSLTVGSVALKIGEYGWTASSTGLRANIFWSKDSTFTTRTMLNSDTLALLDARTTALTAYSYSVSVSVAEGEKFYIRIYPYSTYKNISNTKYICLNNVVISGTTASLVSPSLSAFPDSINFGLANINTTRGVKTLTISGANMSPESDSIRLTAPDGFILSTVSDSGYSSYVALPYSSDTLSSTIVYVKFLPTLVQSYSGIVTVEGGGATTQNVKVAGTGIAADFPIGIFVATTGSDSSAGDYDAPFLTIKHAISVAQVSDTIFVRGGNYTIGSTLAIATSGTDTLNRHCLFAYNNERPILDCSSMLFGSSNRGLSLSGSYWHIKGFDIYKAGDNGMNITGSNNIVELCALYENRDSGLQLSGTASNNRIINCDSYFNYDDSSSAPGGNADGFSPKQLTGVNNYFYGCRSWLNSDDGWDCYEAVASVTIENCWTWKNGYKKDGVTTNSDMNGNGFKLGGNYTENDATLINCLSFNNKLKGFDQNHNSGSMTLYNCTGYNNVGNNYSISEALNTGKTLTLTNCVEYGSKRSIGSFAVLTTNSWTLFTVTAADFVSLDTAGVSGQRQADGSLPDITYMHLASGSQLIDVGTNVGLSYNGTAPDLGCFESDYGTDVGNNNEVRITDFQLLQNYPNPFNPSTQIGYHVASAGIVKISVYDILGREVATLVNAQKQTGNYTVEWNAAKMSSGMYFARLSVITGKGQSFTHTQKMMLTK